jgi:chaperonin GroEL (HSP60 family)
MLKEGHRHLSGLQEAVLKNIDACRELAAITRTLYGPNGGVGIRDERVGSGIYAYGSYSVLL